MKIQTTLTLITAVLSIGVAPGRAHAGDNPVELSASDIIKQAAEKYASLTSYSDEGSTSATLGTITATSYTFSINLARTNLYRIVWRQENQIYTPNGVVWSAGDGNFLWMGRNFTPKKYADWETALAGATGISGGAAASIPGTFFKMNWGNQLGAAVANSQRRADEKIGDVDCYVLTHGTDGRTNTLWIGKSDFLIHQVENDTSAAFMKAIMEKEARNNPQIRALLESSGGNMFKDSKSIETHQNIRINPPLTRPDFDFKVPDAARP